MSIRQRLILGMLLVVAVSGGVSSLIGGYLLWRHLNREAENRVREDLHAAREFYDQRLRATGSALRYTALGERFREAVATRDLPYLATRLDAVRRNAQLDVLSVTGPAGHVIYRAHRPDYAGDSIAADPCVARVLAGDGVVSGTVLVPLPALAREGQGLVGVATTRPARCPRDGPELDAAMMLCAAAPLRGPGGQLVGVLRAGILLNGRYGLVDHVQNTMFRDETYRGMPLGTATVFQNDVRISTNVRGDDGVRAVGTRVSPAVYESVVGQGRNWVGHAWVVNDWCICAYEPIRDIDGDTAGMLCVGLLAGKFGDLTLRTLSMFAVVTLVGLVAAGLIGYRLANRVSRPIGKLATASAAIARGQFPASLPVESPDELGLLTQSFNMMAQALKDRDEFLKERTRIELTRSERLAAVGRLAAGVAHEINNPLTGVLTFAHMLLRETPKDSPNRNDIETIISATMRCRDIVRGLLDFSRQGEPQKKSADLNDVLREALRLTQNQARISQVRVVEELDASLPHLVIDANQIQQVAVNMIVNGIDAMPEGGQLAVGTRAVADNGVRWAEFEIEDTGCGIAAENLDHVFDPFFTTKPTGMGTGLGLAIAFGIVAEHGGRIRVWSEEHKGTRLTVRLPVTSED